MDASHVASGTITALLATVLVYLTHLPLKPLEMPEALAFAGLAVAAAGGVVKLVQMARRPKVAPLKTL
jgi:hypothetical protein